MKIRCTTYRCHRSPRKSTPRVRDELGDETFVGSCAYRRFSPSTQAYRRKRIAHNAVPAAGMREWYTLGELKLAPSFAHNLNDRLREPFRNIPTLSRARGRGRFNHPSDACRTEVAVSVHCSLSREQAGSFPSSVFVRHMTGRFPSEQHFPGLRDGPVILQCARLHPRTGNRVRVYKLVPSHESLRLQAVCSLHLLGADGSEGTKARTCAATQSHLSAVRGKTGYSPEKVAET